MTDITKISPLPQPPQRADAPDVFAGRADAFVAALLPFREQLNELGGDVQSAVAGNLVKFDGFAGVWSAGTFDAGQVVFHTPSNSFYISLQDGETAEPPDGDWRKIGITSAEDVDYENASSGLAADNVQDAIDEVAGDLVNFEETFSGAVQFFARNTAPTGWLKANGAAISRTTFSALFDAIGTTFGSGDGSTTFNLPDMRGEFARGWDDGRGVDSGRSFGTEQGDEFRSHNHAPYRGRSISNGTQNRSWVVGGSEGAIINNISSSISNAGGSETRPRNIALLACIKF